MIELPFALLEYIRERMDYLSKELKEARKLGVNTRGYNQILGSLEELQFLVKAMADEDQPR